MHHILSLWLTCFMRKHIYIAWIIFFMLKKINPTHNIAYADI